MMVRASMLIMRAQHLMCGAEDVWKSLPRDLRASTVVALEVPGAPRGDTEIVNKLAGKAERHDPRSLSGGYEFPRNR